MDSVILPKIDHHIIDFESLPLALGNPNVETFRQALSIDERRAMFRPKPWDMQFQKRSQSRETDIKQVWFAGDHGDVGGGWPEGESGLSKFPLLWMIREAQNWGLEFKDDIIKDIVLGVMKNGQPSPIYMAPNADAELHNPMTFG